MRVRTCLLIVLTVFAATPSHAQRPVAPSIVKRILQFVPRLLGDHLSPPKPTSPSGTATQTCTGATCK